MGDLRVVARLDGIDEGDIRLSEKLVLPIVALLVHDLPEQVAARAELQDHVAPFGIVEGIYEVDDTLYSTDGVVQDDFAFDNGQLRLAPASFAHDLHRDESTVRAVVNRLVHDPEGARPEKLDKFVPTMNLLAGENGE